MTTMVVAHGAWSAGWAWAKMRPLLAARGIGLVTPTYTGLGERSHLAHPGLDLTHHIGDLIQTLHYEDLHDVVLVAHSYGGMVGTGVVDLVPERIRQIIYLDAFVPADGECLLDLVPPEAAATMRAGMVDGWKVAPNPPPPDTGEADLAWVTPRRGHQPIGTFTEPLRLANPAGARPRSYIYCQRIGPGDTFGRFATAAKADSTWRYTEIDASHSPHVTAPEILTETLLELVR